MHGLYYTSTEAYHYMHDMRINFVYNIGQPILKSKYVNLINYQSIIRLIVWKPFIIELSL